MKKDLYFRELLKPLIMNLIELKQIPHLVTVLYAAEKVLVKGHPSTHANYSAPLSRLLPGFYGLGITSVVPEKKSGFFPGRFNGKIDRS